MSFEKRSAKAVQGNYIPVINPDNITAQRDDILSVPSVRIFSQELSHWRKTLRQAKQVGGKDRSQDVIELSEKFTNEIDTLILGRAVAERKLRQPFVSDRDVEQLLHLQSLGAAVIGHSHLLHSQEVNPTLLHSVSTTRGREATFFVDFSDSELSKVGIHADDEVLEGMGFQPLRVGQEVWYEGDTIYVRAARPAEPTIDMMQGYRAKIGQRFDRAALTSLTARVKKTFWLSGT